MIPLSTLWIFIPPFPIAMASFFPVRPVCSAVRKQSTTLPRSLSSSTQPIVPSSGSCSHFSSLCSTSRLMNSRKLSSDTTNPILVGNLATREEKRRKKKKKKKQKKNYNQNLQREETSLESLPNLPIAFTRSSQSSSLPSSVGKGQTRTFLVQLRRQAQTFKQNAPSTDAARPPVNLQLTNLPYFIRRTASNQLPVYLVTKAGGTKQQTKIQKTEGDMDALRSDLAQYLGLESSGTKSPDVTINRLNGHIVVKVCSFPPRSQHNGELTTRLSYRAGGNPRFKSSSSSATSKCREITNVGMNVDHPLSIIPSRSHVPKKHD